MAQEEKVDTQYVGRVLPGSRWLQRAFKGHVEQEVTVLRVGARSVMLVIEGNSNGGAGHDRRKVGQKFNVVLETFLRTHTLISQPKGYRPGDELDPAPAPVEPKVDAVETYFKKRQYAQDWLANVSGADIRTGVSDFPGPTTPVYTGDVLINPPTPQASKEEPMQTAQTEPEQPPEDIVPRELFEDEPASPYTKVMDANDGPAPTPEVDPLDAFLDNGRALVASLTEELRRQQQQREEVAGLLASLDDGIASLTRRRDKAESAVEAAIAAILGVEQPAPEPPALEEVVKQGPVQVQAALPDQVVVRPANNGGVRLAGPMGYVPRPGKLSQRQWILDRFAREGKLVIQEVVDEFVTEYGMAREAAIKNISSIMHHQIKHPSDQWPVPQRVLLGSYAVPLPARVTNQI